MWTSYLKRTVQTAEVAGLKYEKWKALDELDAVRRDSYVVACAQMQT